MTDLTTNPKKEIAMIDSDYLKEIDAEAIRVGYCKTGESLVSEAGPEAWLEAWHSDPSLTAKEQVGNEVQSACESGE
jgi:hypothetical protein